ncbi:MAG TPA: AprI/Inh family metalloprotease inhibitor [Pseudolabrys sp.]|nr:AprI/Inh family metalloprotease inhibitor [Pseudolabrys sp.]
MLLRTIMLTVLSCVVLSGFVILSVAPAGAYDFAPVKPLNIDKVDPSMLTDVFGAWEIRDRSGKRRCKLTLLKETGIGGYQIDVAPNCKAAFPVMDDIAAWRLNEGWSIDLVDGLRKTRIRFETPDSRYIALGSKADIAGIDQFDKLPDQPVKRR